jgi:hypothetical protein
MNLIDLIKQRCNKPKVLRKGGQDLIQHFGKQEWKHHYGVENEDLNKEEHKKAELQTLMDPMLPNLVPQYNELFM